ncbi:BRO family protein [Sphingomonas sp. STIS6.2]|uniref:BRO family protein n=1 Tax=Sphingomonas sp. STIS6.2 TaxID=1379700 RepID=UPI0009DE1F9C|nr:BRO family protein [Sphingomonas sp. STIS6.2]
MSDPNEIEEAFGLNMRRDEAYGRYDKATREEAGSESPSSTGDLVPEGEAQLVIFKGHEIRKVCHEDEWWFSVVDVVGAITQSTNARRYWSDLKRQLIEKDGASELYDDIVQLPMAAADGKMYQTDAATVETLLRIIQAIRSPNAEPFKKWLARVGFERIQEIQNPELAIKRAILTYQLQGRSDDWIEKRVRSIVVRKELTNEWKKRGIEGQQYGLLTNIVSMATFGGVGVDSHKQLKGLKKSHNLRDHMSDLELIFMMLGERSTQEVAQIRDAQGLRANKDAAVAGGGVAGRARQDLERQTGQRVVSQKNFLGTDKRTSDPVKLTEGGKRIPK